MPDHAPQEQSAGAPAPSVQDRIQSLAEGMFSESQDNPNAWEQEEAPAEDAEASEQPSETPEEPAQEATEPPEEMEEVEYAEGKQFKVPKELKRGWMREDDYTRKTQKVAERARQVDAQAQSLEQTAQVLRYVAPKVGELKNLESQIQGLEREMGDPALEQNDPVRLGALAARYNLLIQQHGRLNQEVSAAQQQFLHVLDENQKQSVARRMETEMPVLEAVIKDFNPGKHGKEVADYLQKSGLAQEAMGFINTSPAALALVWKAKAYDQLQVDKKAAQKKVEKLPPVAKPGQRASQAEGDADLKKLRDLNRKTGGKDPEIRQALLKRQLFGR